MAANFLGAFRILLCLYFTLFIWLKPEKGLGEVCSLPQTCEKNWKRHEKAVYHVMTIEIINNTREGIVMFIQAEKGNASNGGQKIQMLK